MRRYEDTDFPYSFLTIYYKLDVSTKMKIKFIDTNHNIAIRQNITSESRSCQRPIWAEKHSILPLFWQSHPLSGIHDLGIGLRNSNGCFAKHSVCLAQQSSKNAPIKCLVNEVMLPICTKRVSTTCCTAFPMQKLMFWLKAV